MNVWGGENRSFWKVYYKVQVLLNILLFKSKKNLKLSMYRVLVFDIWCFKYKNYRLFVKDSGVCFWKGFGDWVICYILYL